MAFASINNYLSKAASRYNLNNQISASLVCQRFRKFVVQNYPRYEDAWLPKKYVAGVLYVQCTNSSAKANFFMQKTFLLKKMQEDDILRTIKNIMNQR
jgi:hypothetical protein